MGVFGIFTLVLTFLYVIYYGFMIFMDLNGKNSKKNGSVEVIPTQPGLDAKELEDEAPTEVNEEDYAGANNQDAPDEEPLTAEEIANLQTDIMYEEVVKARNSMQKIHAKAQTEVSLTKDEELAYDLFKANMVGSDNWDNNEEE